MKRWWYCLFGLFVISFLADKLIVDFFAGIRIAFLNEFMVWFTSGYTILFVAFMFASFFLWNEHKKKWIFPLWLSGLIGFLSAHLLKLVFLRARPDVLSLINQTNYSFPSGHAAVVFAALPILDREFPKLKWAWFVFAVLVVLSRLYVGVHYPSDLLAGCILGFFVGHAFLKRFSRLKSRKK